MKRSGPNPATAAEVRAHGARVCKDTKIANCRVCCALNRQMVDAIRAIKGQSPLYEGEFKKGGVDLRCGSPMQSHPAPWERPLDGRRRAA